MYVIKNQGRYVTWPGCPSSFTYRLEAARKFDSKDAAEREKCGNETVVSVHDILAGVRS